MQHRLREGLHGVLLLLAVLAIGEALGLAAEWRWSFRQRLLDALALTIRHEDPGWPRPEQFWDPQTHPDTEPLAFRTDDDRKESITPDKYPPGKLIFVLGESAAEGYGRPFRETFAARLDALLAPQGVRVLDVARSGAGPLQVMEQARKVLRWYRPTTLIIYTGNNQWPEIYTQLPVGNSWNPNLVQVLSILAQSRALAGVEYLAIRWGLRHRVPPGGTDRYLDGMELRGSRYALAHPLESIVDTDPAAWLHWKRITLERFEDSLDQIVEHARERGVRVVLVTMPFAHRLSPAYHIPQLESFDLAHRTEVRGLLHAAADRVDAGDCPVALETLAKALALDPIPPLPHYLRGECLERMGRFEEAEAAYAQSRENMMGHVGCRLSVNEVIRRVAARHGTPLVDAAKIFDDYEHAHGKHFNEDLIFDNCHLSTLGHEVMTDALSPHTF